MGAGMRDRLAVEDVHTADAETIKCLWLVILNKCNPETFDSLWIASVHGC